MELELSYIKAETKEVTDGLRTIDDCLKHYADKLGEKPSFIYASRNGEGPRQVVCWRELHEKSTCVAKALVTLGVCQDEFVAINIRSCPEWLYLAFGAILAGARVVPLSFTYTDGSDLIAMMKKLETCSLLAFDPGENNAKWNIVKPLTDGYITDGKVSSNEMPYLRYLIGHGFSDESLGLKMLQELILLEPPNVPLPSLNPDSVAVVFQTSGSTGLPKLVAHSHTSLMAIRRLLDHTVVDSNLYLNDRPFNWLGGFPISALFGQTRVTVSEFGEAPENPFLRLLEIIVEEKCNFLMALPSRLQALLDYKEELPKDWPTVAIMTGGQPIARELTHVLGKYCKLLVTSYGSTEVLSVARNIITDPGNYSSFSCGQIIAGSGAEIKVVDDAGSTVPVDTRGELLVKDPGLFKGYFNDPERTAAAFTTDGWFKTDDIGRITKTGEVFVEGRKSSVIISGGLKVIPELLEDVLLSCPGIVDALIVPVPDVVKYQVLCACVAVEKGRDVTESDVRAFCESFHTDKAEVFTVLPKFYLFLDNIPLLRTGKFDRKTVESIAGQKFAA